LRYDGIYRSVSGPPEGKSSWSYLRFYPDGVVIEMSTAATLDEIKAGFSRERSILPRGTARCRDSHLSFSIVCDKGTVDYKGEVSDDRILLDVASRINGHRESEAYIFIK